MIICAALLVQAEGLDHTTIVPCHRHGDGFKILIDLGHMPNTCKVVEQGFINNKGEFLDRTEAFKHAAECGQLAETTRWYKFDHNDTELYSEDLY